MKTPATTLAALVVLSSPCLTPLAAYAAEKSSDASLFCKRGDEEILESAELGPAKTCSFYKAMHLANLRLGRFDAAEQYLKRMKWTPDACGPDPEAVDDVGVFLSDGTRFGPFASVNPHPVSVGDLDRDFRYFKRLRDLAHMLADASQASSVAEALSKMADYRGSCGTLDRTLGRARELAPKAAAADTRALETLRATLATPPHFVLVEPFTKTLANGSKRIEIAVKDPYYIAEYPMTVAERALYAREREAQPRWSIYKARWRDPSRFNHVAIGFSRESAKDVCAWAGWGIPTRDEWIGAQFPGAVVESVFPWGGKFDEEIDRQPNALGIPYMWGIGMQTVVERTCAGLALASVENKCFSVIGKNFMEQKGALVSPGFSSTLIDGMAYGLVDNEVAFRPVIRIRR